MDWKPVETVADQMLYSVKFANTIDESCGSVHDSLETIKLVRWSTGLQTVAVVDPWDDEAIDYYFCVLRWQSSDRTLFEAELVKATADKLVNMRTERQLCVENHSKVAHHILTDVGLVTRKLSVCGRLLSWHPSRYWMAGSSHRWTSVLRCTADADAGVSRTS